MKIIHSQFSTGKELPLKLQLSFEAIFDFLEKTANDKSHHLQLSAAGLLKEFEEYPELRKEFSDFSYLDTYNNQISRLLDILFPDLLTTNEIKAASIPFEFTSFKLSQRFHNILNDAGEDFSLRLRNFEESKMYIMSCIFIMGYCYGFKVDGMRPFYFDIPKKKLVLPDTTEHYLTVIFSR